MAGPRGVGPKSGRRPRPRDLLISGIRADSNLWAVVSQGLNGLSSFLMTTLVARSAGLGEFGRFSAAMIGYLVLITALRSTIGQTLMITDTGPEERCGVVVAAAGVGGLAAIATAGISAAVGAEPHLWLVLLLGIPFVAVQDTYRYLLIGDGRPRAAAGLDLCWLVAMGALLTSIAAVGTLGTVPITASWLVAAAVVVIPFAAQTSWAEPVRHARGWLERNWATMRPLGYEGGLLLASGNLSAAIVGGIAGLDGLGAFRAAQIALAPMTTFLTAMQITAFRRIGLHREDAPAARTQGTRLMIESSTVVAVWVAALLVLPKHVGSEALGDSWVKAHTVFLPQGIALLVAAVVNVGYTYLKVMQSAESAWQLRIRTALLDPALCTIGAVLGGVRGACWGLAASQVAGLVALTSWTRLHSRRGAVTP